MRFPPAAFPEYWIPGGRGMILEDVGGPEDGGPKGSGPGTEPARAGPSRDAWIDAQLRIATLEFELAGCQRRLRLCRRVVGLLVVLLVLTTGALLLGG